MEWGLAQLVLLVLHEQLAVLKVVLMVVLMVVVHVLMLVFPLFHLHFHQYQNHFLPLVWVSYYEVL